jgi:hypothetical protein
MTGNTSEFAFSCHVGAVRRFVAPLMVSWVAMVGLGCGSEKGAPDQRVDCPCLEPRDAAPDRALDQTPDRARDRAVDQRGDVPGDQLAARDGQTGDGQTRDGQTRDGLTRDVALDLPASRCPSCMVLINGSFCIDKYEASRPDATAASQGVLDGAAQCKPQVMPWWSSALGRAEAGKACQLAGKRLCSQNEWQQACQGPAKTVYSYGDTYHPTHCNGIDRFTSPRVTTTGSHSQCVNAWGLYDFNGNVWEVVTGNDGLDHFRGGAFNCIDSAGLHRCDSDVTSGVSARGFRCCKDPS